MINHNDQLLVRSFADAISVITTKLLKYIASAFTIQKPSFLDVKQNILDLLYISYNSFLSYIGPVNKIFSFK
jgi:hypothetical protein